MRAVAWEPSPEFLERANMTAFMRLHGLPDYEALLRSWIADPDWFWSAAADAVGVAWYERPTHALDVSRGIEWPRWFGGGTTNLVLSCLEQQDPGARALVWEGEEGNVRTLTFGELLALVSRIAGGLRSLGVSKGDRVGLFLPLTPEAVACVYACARIGAIYVPAFSGYAEEAVAVRMRDAGVKVIVTADGFYRRGRRVDMRATAEAAARAVPGVEHVVVLPRTQEVPEWEQRFLAAEPVTENERVAGDHPFMIAYTSGTTGRPKGTVHTHASWPLRAATETLWHMDQQPDELMFWMSDLGWIMAPLSITGCHLTGRPLFLYDGAPDHPGPSRIAEMIEHHRVGVFGTSPTFVRSLMGRDDHGFDGRHKSIRVLSGGGEVWTEPAWWWYFDRVGGGRCPLINQAGGTEAGAILASLPIRPITACTFNSAATGVDPDVFGEDGRPAPPGTMGELVVRQPWVGETQGFWQDDARYIQSYWSRWPDVWVHGDLASRDENGYWLLHGRSDDTLMIAGKRLGPSEVEAVIAEHPAVRAVAAIGVPHELKGEAVWCFVVLHDQRDADTDELAALVAAKLGKPFAPERVYVVPALPQTRNAKILRRAIRSAARGEDAGDLSSLDNPEALDQIRRVVATVPAAPS